MDRGKKQVLQANETFLDAAAGEALGINSAADAAICQQETAASPAAASTVRELCETVGMMSAASPYMEPPEELRARVVQATAPANFRMEDYRRANREVGRFYRWGFYAAMLFLMAGAWYNLSLKSALTRSNANFETASKQAAERDVALRAFVNPNVEQISFRENGKVVGKALVDDATHTAVVILPQGMIPAGKSPQLSIPRNGKQVKYDTILVIAPPNMLDAPPGKTLDSMLAVKDMTPDPHQPQIAGK